LPGIVAQGSQLLEHEPAVSQAAAAAFGVLTIAIVPLALARLHGVRWGALAALAIVSVPAFSGLVANQQSDIPVAAYVGCSAALIALAHAQRVVSGRVLA